ncbi:glycoside hydrolase family 76 protein [Belliella sp. DSM 111904]|uniref:Glycoside hydrolase family 76 protein n=1 Tax=Belliella filtrata TaxID=2923435 RepID=A0ABS9UY25_9BACT|nr:glycoside hydrolase family 76 protein [Belliella filtrata]MCH7409087.1 glycoside hydrolase family 76 protein [Belliella filtrata]
MAKFKMYIIFLMILSLSLNCKDSLDDQLTFPDEKEEDPVETLTYRERAKAVYDMIQMHYREGELYKENFPSQPGENRYCYLWPYVGMLTAGNVLYELGYDKSIFDREFEGLERYYDDRDLLPTYQAYPRSEQSTDHYYDDSAIVAMELITAYRLTGNPFYLERAKLITDFIMSGEDDRMGGGLYWFERVSTNCMTDPNCIKAANTTAYAAYVTSELFLITNENLYNEFAKRTYQWNYDNLRDPADNVYWNDIHIGTGNINTRKWTYNAAMMIMSGINLYEISGDEKYIDQAKATAAGAFSRFTSVVNDQLFYPDHDSWFNVELMSSYIELAAYDPKARDYIQVFLRNLDYAWENARNDRGQFYEDWSGNNQGRYYWLLHQAALIEAYGRASLFLEE